MNEINYLIGTSCLTDILTPLALDKTQSPTDLFYQALKDNRVTDFNPNAPLYLFHSEDDDMVPFSNSRNLRQALQQQHAEDVQYDFGHYGSHLNAALLFFRKVFDAL